MPSTALLNDITKKNIKRKGTTNRAIGIFWGLVNTINSNIRLDNRSIFDLNAMILKMLRSYYLRSKDLQGAGGSKCAR
jgi:hypothetical protein